MAIPWEYDLWVRMQNTGHLPKAGGLLDQPHLLMTHLEIISIEHLTWAKEKQQQQKLIDETNERLRKAHEERLARGN